MDKPLWMVVLRGGPLDGVRMALDEGQQSITAPLPAIAAVHPDTRGDVLMQHHDKLFATYKRTNQTEGGQAVFLYAPQETRQETTA